MPPRRRIHVSPLGVPTRCRSEGGLAPFLAQVCGLRAAAPVAYSRRDRAARADAGAWVHSASTADFSLFTMHPVRGHEAIRAAGVLPLFGGIAVHDGFTAYRRHGAAHQLCNAHHLRELAGVLEMDPDRQTWADQMILLLCETNDLAPVRPAETSRWDRGFAHGKAHKRSAPSAATCPPPEHGINALDALTQLHNGQCWLPRTS